MSVEEENKWIEAVFDCDITTLVFDKHQLELIEQGFPVKPNKEVAKGTIPKEHLQEVIDRFE